MRDIQTRPKRIYYGQKVTKGILCMLINVFVFLGSVQAQEVNQTYSFEFRNEHLASVFKKIEKTTGYMINFNHEDVASYTTTCSIRKKKIREILDVIIADKALSYKLDGKFITISVKRQTIQSNSKSELCIIKGNVIGEDVEPLPGAHIRVEGVNSMAVTNAKGEYTLRLATGKSYIIRYSYVGMVDQKMAINIRDGQQVHEVKPIILKEDKNVLDEVVVTGYQTLRKSQVAGSVSVVKAENVKIGGVPSIEDMLQGQVTGMNVILNSGDPGASAKIRIRGTSSILGNRAPLWVLDGVILSEDDMREIKTTDLNGDDAAYLVGNAIAGINPNDIDKITVLKDASATSIYGVQAANGVIVVTTKQGRSGSPKISYSGSFKVNQRISYKDLRRMNATERLQLSEEIIDDAAYYSQMPVGYGYEGLYMNYIRRKITYDDFSSGVQKLAKMNTDWYDILFRNSFTNSHSVSLSGGNDGTRYYASFGYDDTQSTAIKNYSRRFTTMAKINSWIIKNKLYIGFQVNASTRKTLGFHSSVNPNTYAYNTSRAIPAFNDDGSRFLYNSNSGSYSKYGDIIYYNILNEMDQTGQDARVNSITAQLNLQWNIWGGLKYKLQASYQNYHSTKKSWATDDSYYVAVRRKYSKNFLDTYVADEGDMSKNETRDASPIPVGGIYSSNNSQDDTYTIQNTFEFDHTFKKDHFVNLMAVSEIRQIKTYGLMGTYYGWQPDRGDTFSPVITPVYTKLLASGALNPILTNQTKNYVSWIFTGSYSYKDKLVFNANLRMDGSNQFGSNPKYRFLPIWSVSGKYTLSNEAFMQNQHLISYLAFRGSYGIQGNVDAGTSPNLVIKLGSQNSITGMNEATIAYLPNPDLRWEKTKSFNIGCDLALFDNRASFILDFYKKRGSDMIMAKDVSQINGVKTVKINAGKVNNSGIEVGANFIPLKTKNWDVTIGINYSYNNNELVDANDRLVTLKDKINGNALVVGEAIGTLYSYDFAGLNHESGYPVFRNVKGETTFTNALGVTYPNYVLFSDEANLVRSGVLTAPHQGGINISIGYKGLRLSSSFTYQLGGIGRLSDLYGSAYQSAFDPMSNTSKEYIHRWRQPGDEVQTNIPVLYNNRVYNGLFNKDLILGKSYVYGTTMYDKSTARIASTDFLKLRSLSLNYIVPQKLISRFSISQCSVGLQATNLFTWASSKWEGSDPEAAYATSPLSRAYSLNLNITF